MTEIDYNEIHRAWSTEVEMDELQSLEDSRLGKMVSLLQELRVQHANTSAEDSLRAELLARKIQNVEYMLTDLLKLRRDKMLSAALSFKRPVGNMTLPEEEFYNRVSRAVEGYSEFMDEILAGKRRPDAAVASGESSGTAESQVEYVTVRFVRPVEMAFVGIDEATYGPFKAEDVAVIPADNARSWLRDGTVMRVVVDNLEKRK